MNIKIYKTPGEFLEENKAFLQEHEAACQLNLGNASAHKDEPCHPGLLFGRCEEDGRGVLLFGNTLPWNLCLNSIPGDPAALSAAVLLADYLQRENIEITGINASKTLCNAFFSAYNKPYQVRVGMDIMVQKELIEPPVVSGKVRKAELSDLDTAADWACAFQKEALHEDADPEEMREKFRETISQGKVYLLEAPDGTLVSMAAATARSMPHGVGISWVYTPPEYRGRGYCQNTVAHICREVLRDGYDYCTLFVDKANPISNRVYQKIGFEIIEDNFDCRLVKDERK